MKTFYELFTEGYKDDPRKLRAMKKSGTRGTGIDPNEPFIQAKNQRKEKTLPLKQRNECRKLLSKVENRSEIRTIKKYAEKFGLDFIYTYECKESRQKFEIEVKRLNTGQSLIIHLMYFENGVYDIRIDDEYWRGVNGDGENLPQVVDEAMKLIKKNYKNIFERIENIAFE